MSAAAARVTRALSLGLGLAANALDELVLGSSTTLAGQARVVSAGRWPGSRRALRQRLADAPLGGRAGSGSPTPDGRVGRRASSRRRRRRQPRRDAAARVGRLLSRDAAPRRKIFTAARLAALLLEPVAERCCGCRLRPVATTLDARPAARRDAPLVTAGLRRQRVQVARAEPPPRF